MQNTKSVEEISPINDRLVGSQIEIAIASLGVDAIKIGMLANQDIVSVVFEKLKQIDVPIVIDPVLKSNDGTDLFADVSPEQLKPLYKLATILTPNISEAEKLTGVKVNDEESAHAALNVLKEYTKASGQVLLKGGDLAGDFAVDYLYDGENFQGFAQPKINANCHGTGCAFSAVLACELAKKTSLHRAVIKAKDFVHVAIKNRLQFGDNRPLLYFSS